MKNENPLQLITNLVRRRNRNRLWITIVTLLILFGIVFGLGYAMVWGVEMTAPWRELLLLILGAFIGAYGKVMDYWFADTEKDMLLIEQITGQPRHSIRRDSEESESLKSTQEKLDIRDEK